MHLYEVVGSQGGQKLKCCARNETERITNFNDSQEYMSLCGPRQEESSEYQQPQQCGSNIKTAENTEGAPEYHVLIDKLKQIKICLLALCLLIVILFLITASSLGLAAYCFISIKSSSGIEYRQNTINSEVVSQKTFINNFESQFNAEVAYQRIFISNVESQLNTTNAEVASQRTFISSLESQFNTISAEITSQRIFINSQLNEIDSDVSTVSSSVTNLQNQLISTNSSLHIALRSQPSK